MISRTMNFFGDISGEESKDFGSAKETMKELEITGKEDGRLR